MLNFDLITKRTAAGLVVMAVTAVLATGTMSAQTGGPGTRLVLEEGSRMWIEGGSSLHDWSCEVPELDLEAELTETVEADADGGAPAEVSGFVTVPVKAIRCDKEQMDGNLRKALKAKEHANIEFRTVRPATLPEVRGTEPVSVVLEGELEVAGTARPVQVEAEVTREEDGSLRVRGNRALLMTDFGIKPPTAMLGLLKTHDEMRVRFDLRVGAR